MPDSKLSGVTETEEKALEGISVSPPVPETDDTPPPDTDAASQPDDADAKLDAVLEETFPSSDAPSTTHPDDSGEPAPSSGYDPDAEPD